MRGKCIVSFLTAVFLAAVLPARAAQNPPPAKEKARPERGTVIGPEDTITISVLNAEEISKPWRVNEDGELNLPMVGRMRVAGMTVEEFERDLTSRLRKFYIDPQVSAFVSDIRSHPVTVTGPVEKPGTYQLPGDRTLFEVLVMAGGPKESAGSSVTLTRAVERGGIDYPGVRTDETGRYNVVEVSLKEAMDAHAMPAGIPVLPYDVVAVTDYKPQRMVHIAGEVNKPGAVELVSQETVSLTKVLAMAGGLTRTASAGKTMIMHLNSQGVQTSTAFVDLKKIVSGKARDLDLTAGDVVIVPSNTVMAYVQALSMAAVTTGVYVLGRI